jgi:hypothetical protein
MIVTELINFRNILIHIYVIVLNTFKLQIAASVMQHEQGICLCHLTGFSSQCSGNRFLLLYRLLFFYSHV